MKYNYYKYEVKREFILALMKFARIIITPCPHYPDILIGSMRCRKCKYWEYQNSGKQYVKCSHKTEKAK